LRQRRSATIRETNKLEWNQVQRAVAYAAQQWYAYQIATL